MSRNLSYSNDARGQIQYLEDALAKSKKELHEALEAKARVHRAYMHVLEQLQLLRRRLFVAKAERADVASEQLAFEGLLAEARRLEKELAKADEEEEKSKDEGNGKGPDTRAKPKGRRNLSETDLPVIRVEISDPELEKTAERIGVEETWRLGYERGGMRRIVLERIVYKVADAKTHVGEDGTIHDVAAEIVTAPLPKELSRRSFLAPSMIAHILTSKYLLGVPFYRLEQQMALQGAPLDRGTMCRYAEDVGATLGVIVNAMKVEALETAFCLSTDATGVCIQPGPMAQRKVQSAQPCRKGHFFVVLADRDHVFFEYQTKHTSLAVSEMFRGYSGYIQADAHAVYDALFDGRAPRGSADDDSQGPPPIEVGCWSHARRNFWEAAVCKHPLGVEGLRRINAIFAMDATLSDLPPSKRKTRRDAVVRPLVDSFFEWVSAHTALPRERGLVATALGYARNQQAPLRRFLDDGRLRMENNQSERALRAIASARKLWMFFGSDDHAAAAANLFSLVASCKLHGLDPEAYLADVIRVIPYWPRDRYLELAPRYWADTRGRLLDDEMTKPLGHVTVPETTTKEQSGPR